MSGSEARSAGVEPSCPSCGAPRLEHFYEQEAVPSHSCLLLASPHRARDFPRGDIRLGFCPACGFIANTAVDTSLQAYSSAYEETQGFSPRFRTFARDLAGRLVERHGIYGKDVLEIGCGKGEFLVLLCELGGNRGVGIDPSVAPDRLESEAGDRITWIADYYSEKYADLTGDLVVCRHTLEHIAATGDFMRLTRRAIGDRTDVVVFFELPDVGRVLREAAFWDIYYEHCSYFSPGSLARLMRGTGFEVLDLALGFDDQYILIEARPAPAGTRVEGEPPTKLEESPQDLRADVERFQESFTRLSASWKDRLGALRETGRRAVVWGSGSKGVSFLTTLGVESEIEFVVDINPHKHGKFMAGTGQRIVAPEFLRDYRPDLVIAMNPIYRAEIQSSLDDMDVGAELLAV